MEILNTIWSALTSENEILTNVLFIPLTFVEIWLTTLLFVAILKISYTFKQMLSYIISFSIFAIIFSFFVPTPFNTFFNIITCPILIILIFKVTPFKAILAEVIPNIIFVIVSIILHNIFIALFNLPTTLLATIPIYKVSFSVITYFIVYLLYCFFKNNNINISILDTLKKKDNIILTINFVIGIIAIGIQSYISSLYSDVLPFYISLIDISILLVYFIFSLYSLSRTNQLETTTQNLEQSREYNKTLEILHDNIRVFKHDLGNIMTTMGGYIQVGDLEKLRNYYNGLQSDFNKINNLNVLSPFVINEPAIYSLLTNKYHLAESKGITVNLEIFLDLKELRMDVYQFTRILGILMDNAIEASSECEEKIISVAIRKDFHSERQLLIIENTYTNKNIDTEKIFEKGYSTKENNTGIGLWEVRQILKKNNNLNLFTSKTNKFFSQQLEIY